MSKTAILRTAFDAIYWSGAAKLFEPHWGGLGVIFCLHHVVPSGGLQSGFAPNSQLEITPEFLAELIRFVKAKGYETISIDEMTERLNRGTQSKQRFAVFTLDDGYKDNLVHAMPVFKAHNCPFTVYVAPRIADGTCELWWRNFEAVIASNSSIAVDVHGCALRLDTTTTEKKWAAWKKLAPQLQAMPEYSQREWIRQVSENHGVDVDGICRTAAMTWNEIREMAQERLATIGAHTLNHYNLKKLSAEDATREIVESGLRIEAELRTKVQHFAYPYGNTDAADSRDFNIAKNAGYKSAVVTRLGTVLPEHKDHLQALPRVMVSGRYQKLNYIEALLSGVPSRLTHKFRGLNVD
jgi:peptidoglycan/xylan/chitin deacetylase (PgdA/CDA1 family)